MSRVKKFVRIPVYLIKDYEEKNIRNRVKWLKKMTNTKLKSILDFSESTTHMRGNIENLIGVAKIPIGLCGPIKINGEYAKGYFLIPLATTEGVLVTSYHKGMIVLSKSDGVSTKIIRDEIHISPVFKLYSSHKKKNFCIWIKSNFKKIKKEAESTTKHGKLLYIETNSIDNLVILRFVYNTADAMGMNMINKATLTAVEYISKNTKIKDYFIRSNFSSDKKPCLENLKRGYGKSVLATAIVKKKYLELLQTTPRQIYEYYRTIEKISQKCKMIGMNGQFANGLAALFIACGQDIASVANSALGISGCNITKNDDLQVYLYLPNLVIGTVGGGTGLSTQKECLSILECYGKNKAKKLAEIAAATLLAGELSIAASVAGGTFVRTHERLGRNRP